MWPPLRRPRSRLRTVLKYGAGILRIILTNTISDLCSSACARGGGEAAACKKKCNIGQSRDHKSNIRLAGLRLRPAVSAVIRLGRDRVKQRCIDASGHRANGQGSCRAASRRVRRHGMKAAAACRSRRDRRSEGRRGLWEAEMVRDSTAKVFPDRELKHVALGADGKMEVRVV